MVRQPFHKKYAPIARDKVDHTHRWHWPTVIGHRLHLLCTVAVLPGAHLFDAAASHRGGLSRQARDEQPAEPQQAHLRHRRLPAA